MKTIGKCALCENSSELQESHIIPKFANKWIKNTSATGRLRFVTNPNVAVQDGSKRHLLCQKCEQVFRTFETPFANELFYPYVNSELDEFGVAKGVIKHFDYSDWLLKCVISIHWRNLVTINHDEVKLGPETRLIVDETILVWRKYLLGEINNTGRNETYLIFLQNLIGGVGTLPPTLNSHVNWYLLRSVDSTITTNKKGIGVYAKLGPIASFTTFKPEKLRGMSDCKIHMNGRIKTAQNLSNSRLNQFIFITRPHESMSRYVLSNDQSSKINQRMVNAFEKKPNTMTENVLLSDFLLHRRIEGRDQSKP